MREDIHINTPLPASVKDWIEKELSEGHHHMVRERLLRVLNELERSSAIKASAWANLDEGYKMMAADEVREKEAMEWCEGLTGDAGDDGN